MTGRATLALAASSSAWRALGEGKLLGKERLDVSDVLIGELGKFAARMGRGILELFLDGVEGAIGF